MSASWDPWVIVTGAPCAEGKAMVAMPSNVSVTQFVLLVQIVAWVRFVPPPGSKPCDIMGAALRCILKGTALFLQDDICKNIGQCLTPNQQMVVLLYKQWLRSVLSSEPILSTMATHIEHHGDPPVRLPRHGEPL